MWPDEYINQPVMIAEMYTAPKVRKDLIKSTFKKYAESNAMWAAWIGHQEKRD